MWSQHKETQHNRQEQWADKAVQMFSQSAEEYHSSRLHCFGIEFPQGIHLFDMLVHKSYFFQDNANKLTG
jgi:hypothetical protein